MSTAVSTGLRTVFTDVTKVLTGLSTSGPRVGTSGPSVGTSWPSVGTSGPSVGTSWPSASILEPSVSTFGPSANVLDPSASISGTNTTSDKHYSWRVVLTMGNDVVLATVCIILAIHIIICVFQIGFRWVAGKIPLYAKCRDGRRVKNTNDYIVTLVTGSRADSGTYGKLRLNLHGQHANSGDFVVATTLNEAVLGLPLLKRGHSDAFIISSKDILGDIQYMEVELLAESVSESWFLSYATVLDLGNQAHWYLPCHRWFSATIKEPHNQVLLAESGTCSSLWVDNFYRSLREVHVWLAPWCSSLLASRIQMLYSLTLCYCAVSSLMFVYMLVFYAPFGAPHLISQRPFTPNELVYLFFSSLFITFIITVLQLLMRIASLRSGSFLSNYTIICVGNSDEGKSGRKHEHDRNAGNNFYDDDERGLSDNVNWNASGAEGMLGKWEKMWHEVKPVPVSSSVTTVSGMVVGFNTAALESWLLPLVQGLCAAGVKLLDEDMNLEPFEQILANGLKDVFGGITVSSSSLVGRVPGSGTNGRSDGENFATGKFPEWSADGGRVSNTADGKAGLQLAGKPTVELLSHSISVRATNSALFLLEMKTQDTLDALSTRRNRNLQLVHDSGDSQGPREKRARRFFWDYAQATSFCPEDLLSKQCAELLTCERLQDIATKTLSEVTSPDLLESIDTTLDAYIDKELQDFIGQVVQTSYTAIKHQMSDHETLLRYEIETQDEVCDEVKSGIYPAILRSVTNALSDELAALQDLVWKLRMAAIAGKHMNVVLNNLALNNHVQFCRMLAGRRNVQTRFCDALAATETGRVVKTLCSSEASEVKGDMLARIRKVLLEVELIKNEDIIVNGKVKFEDGREWSREITRAVILQMYEKMFATTSCDEKLGLSETTELPEVSNESSRFIWVLVVKDARNLFSTSLRTIRRNVHGCRVESLAPLGEALWVQGPQLRQLSILESVRAEMEEGVFGLAIESVADTILEVTAMPDEDEALAKLSAIWSVAAEVTNEVTSQCSMEEIITDSDDAFDSNNNNRATSAAKKEITVSEVFDDFRNLRIRLGQLGNITNRLVDGTVRNNAKTNQLMNKNTRYNSDKNRSTNQNVRQDFDRNQSANHAALNTATDYSDEEATNQNNAHKRPPRHATVEVDTPQSDMRDLVDKWVDDGGNILVLSVSYILFVLLVVLCAACLAGTLALGVTLSSSEAWSWVRVLCVGLACHFFLLEIFKVCLVALFFAACQGKLMM